MEIKPGKLNMTVNEKKKEEGKKRLTVFPAWFLQRGLESFCCCALESLTRFRIGSGNVSETLEIVLQMAYLTIEGLDVGLPKPSRGASGWGAAPRVALVISSPSHT